MAERTCYWGGILIAGDALQPLEGAALVEEGGRILSIGQPDPNARQVDLSGKLVCPMFVDCHCHLGDTGLKELGVNLQMEKVLNPPDGLKHRYLKQFSPEAHIEMMRLGLVEMLQNGIIACADFREPGLAGVRALRQAATGLPIQVIILGRMDESAAPDQVEAEAHALMQEADGIGVRDVESYDPEILKRIRAAYPERLLAGHASERRAAEQESFAKTQRGQAARALEWQPDFLVHLVHSPPEELRLLAEQGVTAVACARSNGILGDGLPNLAEWQQMGLSIALGSDNMMFCSPDMTREMDYVSRLVRGLEESTTCFDTRAVLHAATLGGARALKLENRLGSLAPGKDASFIVFDTGRCNLTYVHDWVSAVVHRATVADIERIVVAGKDLREYL
jgi:cytosine/adenosine deaminase-related metal-dependent hydrolase